LYLSSSNLGLPDISYYNASAPGKMKTLISYIQMVKDLCKLLKIDDISDVISLESFYSAHINKLEDANSILIKGHELQKIFQIFPWNNFFTSYGIDNWKNKSYRIQSKKYFYILQKSFIDVPLEQFKKLFKLHLILNTLLILPKPYNNLYFEFYQNKLKGQKEKYSQKYLTLILIKKHLSIPLSILYKKEFLEISLKRDATKFIEKIRSSALKQIASNTWLQESTKKTAIEKVKNMTLSIGWPTKYYELNLPILQTDNLLENIYLLSAASTAKDIKLLNTESIPGTTWEEPAFMVNAFYYNEINEFVIPAGSLQYPFYSDKSSIGWNYGGLGAVIGHEMIHAFDENGRNYNDHGLFKQWWCPIDNRRYSVIIKKLEELYTNSTIYETHINGDRTVSENLADLGGLSIALGALKDELKGVSEKKRIDEIRQFFISYAISWRTKEEKKKVLQSLIIDTHSPPEFRVNNIVNQFDEWYEVFNVEVGNKMFVAPEERIRVF
jgi:putative endopeptidase